MDLDQYITKYYSATEKSNLWEQILKLAGEIMSEATLRKGEFAKYGNRRPQTLLNKIKSEEEEDQWIELKPLNKFEVGKVIIDPEGDNTKEALKTIEDFLKLPDNEEKLKGTIFKDTQFDILCPDGLHGKVVKLGDMQKTAEYGGRGAGVGPKAAAWEAIISIAHNGNTEGIGSKDLARVHKYIQPQGEYLQTAKDILKNITDDSDPLPEDKFIPMGSESGTPTDLWIEAFREANAGKPKGATLTSKTDVISGNIKMSFKKAGGSQLMSGGRGETMATIMAVERSHGEEFAEETRSLIKEMKDDVRDQFAAFKLSAGGTITQLQQSIADKTEEGTVLTAREVMIDVQETLNKEMTSKIRTLLKETRPALQEGSDEIYNSKSFKYYVCEEALTGNLKFGKNSNSAATHLFSFNPNAEFCSFKTINEKLIEEITPKTSFNISWKTSGTGGRTWIALKGIMSESKQSFTIHSFLEMVAHTTIAEELGLVEDELLSEGLLGTLSGALLRKIGDASYLVYNKVMAKLEKSLNIIFEKLMELASRGLSPVASFLGFEMAYADTPANPDVADLAMGNPPHHEEICKGLQH